MKLFWSRCKFIGHPTAYLTFSLARKSIFSLKNLQAYPMSKAWLQPSHFHRPPNPQFHLQSKVLVALVPIKTFVNHIGRDPVFFRMCTHPYACTWLTVRFNCTSYLRDDQSFVLWSLKFCLRVMECKKMSRSVNGYLFPLL